MYLKRKIYDRLVEWKNDKSHRTLEVNGARQTGKTYIINKFADENFFIKFTSICLTFQESSLWSAMRKQQSGFLEAGESNRRFTKHSGCMSRHLGIVRLW